jgi:putative phosphotransacetylase
VNLLGRFKIDRSANHCHLSTADADTLFGKDIELTLKPLAIKGEYVTNLKVTGQNGINYTVLYPWRSYSQVELAASDYFKLFKLYPKRVASGNVECTQTLTVSGHTSTNVDVPVIVAEAHVHIAKESDAHLLDSLNFPFPLGVKFNESTDDFSHIHLDVDQFAAIQGL